MTTNTQDDPLIGQTLQGRWHVRQRLGGGGMGTVYLAEQLSMGGRPVALKVLHPEYSRDPDFVRRFHFEAQQAGRSTTSARPRTASSSVVATQLPSERSEPATMEKAAGEAAAPEPAAPDPKLREHLAMARFFADRGEYDDAIGEYEAALALDPGNADATTGLEQTRSAQAAERALLGE